MIKKIKEHIKEKGVYASKTFYLGGAPESKNKGRICPKCKANRGIVYNHLTKEGTCGYCHARWKI